MPSSGLRVMPKAEFALACGGLHFLLAAASTALAVSAAYDLSDVVFLVVVGYFAAFSIWTAARAWLFLGYLGTRPPRGATSAILHLAGGLVVLFGAGVAVTVGPLAIALGLFGAAFVVPTAATAWAIQPFELQRRPRSISWTVAEALVLGASAVLLALLLVALWPRAT